MVSALRRALGRSFACLSLLLPFETTASDVDTRTPAEAQVQPKERGDAPQPPQATPPSWQAVLEQFGLLLPKIPQMPSACRPARQYRTYSLDKMPRQPCYYV